MSALQLSRAVPSDEIIWDTYSVGGGNLQKINVINEDTAFVAGYDRSFIRSANGGNSWERLDLITSQTRFLDQSYIGNLGYIIGNRANVIDYDSKTGYPDVFADGVLLKYDNGILSVLDNTAIGEGGDPTKNPNADGCAEFDFMAVEALSENTFLVAVRWSDFNTGEEIQHTGIFKTEDAGETWSHVLDCGTAFITSIIFEGATGYVAGNSFFQQTTDGGSTFSDLFPKLESLADDKIYISNLTMVSANALYISTTVDGVFYTNDGGTTFSEVGTLSGANDFLPIDDQTFLVGGTKTKAMLSVDGGATYESFHPGYTSYKVVGPWNDSVYFLGKGNMAVISMEDLKNKNVDGFKTRTFVDGNNLTGLHIFDNNTAVISAFGATLYETEDAGNSWNEIEMPDLPVNGANFDFISFSTSPEGTGYLTARNLKFIDYASSSNLIDAYHPGVIFKTKNNWNSWELYNVKNIGVQYTDPDKNPSLEGCYNFEVFTSNAISDNTALFYGSWRDSVTVQGAETRHGRIFRTENDGETWEIVSEDLGSSIIENISVHQNLCFVSGNNVLLKSTDGGKTLTNVFENISQYTVGTTYIKDISFRDENHFYLATTSDSIFETLDGGETFKAMEVVKGANDFLALTDSIYFAAGSTSKTMYSQDAGKTWLDARAAGTIWEVGSVWNETVIALGKGEIYTTAIASFGANKYQYPTAVDESFAENINPLKVVNVGSQLEVRLKERVIDQCYIFNAQGMRIAVGQPNDNVYQVNKDNFNSGVYIVVALSGNDRFIQKILIH